MTLDRGTLARIDRRILAQLDGAGRPQLVKIPVSDATWDVWRRYCQLASVTMGEGLALLLAHELANGDEGVAPGDRVLSGTVAARVTQLLDTIAGQRRVLQDARDRLRLRDEQIRHLQQQLRAAEHQLANVLTTARPTRGRVSRNDRCPCGSGLKYKFCHAVDDRLIGG